jgi:mannose-6-phosphate isomerase-like protein (cupin superfamily)
MGCIIWAMSYPEAVYHGDTGEVSARLRPSATPPDLSYPNGTTVDYLSTGASTDGGFGLYRWNMAAGSGGPDLHFHRTISETFFILSGTVTLGDSEKTVEARPGDHLYVPPGGLHSFKNHADEPASMLLLFSPGAPREGYFEGLLEIAEGRRLTGEELSAFFLEHDNIYVK